jgi:DNA-binding beta-propeller fold protein YncE
MKRESVVFLIMLLSFVPAAVLKSQTAKADTCSEGWTKTYGGTYDDGADALVETVDGGYAQTDAAPTGSIQPVASVESLQATSFEVVSTIKLDKEPHAIAVNEETNRVYVGAQNGIIVVDGAAKQVLTTIPTYLGGTVRIVVDSKNSRIFVQNSSNIFTIDGVTNSIVGAIAGSHDIALDSERSLCLYNTCSALQ